MNVEEIAMNLYFSWWEKPISEIEWDKVSEETKECYRIQARNVLHIEDIQKRRNELGELELM